MFERFTDRSRKVMALANQEAQRFNHEYIGTEHILLGLVKEGCGVAAQVLKNLGMDLRAARLEVEKLVKRGPDNVTMGKLPQTPGAKQVIVYAIEESRSLNHNYVGTEHLLLGLLRETDGIAAQVLMNLGLRLEAAREEVLKLVAERRIHETAAPAPEAREQPVRPELRVARRLAQVGDDLNAEINRLVAMKDDAIVGAEYEKAAELRDRAEAVRRTYDEIVREFNELCRKAEGIVAELRKQGGE